MIIAVGHKCTVAIRALLQADPAENFHADPLIPEPILKEQTRFPRGIDDISRAVPNVFIHTALHAIVTPSMKCLLWRQSPGFFVVFLVHCLAIPLETSPCKRANSHGMRITRDIAEFMPWAVPSSTMRNSEG